MDSFLIALSGVAVCSVSAFISVFTLLISIISWIFIPKWRTFKNYVFLNIIFAFNVIYCLPIILILTDFFSEHKLIFFAVDIVINFFMFASCCWLMVMAMQFYTDLVKVFGSTVTRKILKCNIFGWGLPFAVSIGKVINKLVILLKNEDFLTKEDIIVTYHDYFYYEEIGQNVVLILLLVVNFTVYIIVVFVLMKKPTIRSSGIRAQKIQVATLAFVMSGILLMVSILFTILMLVGQKDKYYLYPFSLVLFGLQTAVINICFLRSRANREIWRSQLESFQRGKQEDRQAKNWLNQINLETIDKKEEKN